MPQKTLNNPRQKKARSDNFTQAWHLLRNSSVLFLWIMTLHKVRKEKKFYFFKQCRNLWISSLRKRCCLWHNRRAAKSNNICVFIPASQLRHHLKRTYRGDKISVCGLFCYILLHQFNWLWWFMSWVRGHQ